MSALKEIRVFQIASTVVDRDSVRRWLDHIGADEFQIPDLDAVSDPALLVALAGKRCYMSFQKGLNPNINRIRSDYVDYFDNIMEVAHGSILEHAVFSYAIEGITRVGTAELNRHRAGMAISEGSLRFIRFDEDIPYWLPISLRPATDDDADLAERKRATRDEFHTAFAAQEQSYARLVKIWDMDAGNHNFGYKKRVTSCLRRIVGLGVCTGGVWTGNVRALRHIFTMRCEPAAEEEICSIFSTIVADMAQQQPLLFGDFYRDDAGFWRPKYKKV